MKKILLACTLSAFGFWTSAQVTMNVMGQSTDISGSVYTINADPTTDALVNIGFLDLEIEVHNNTGSSQNWRLMRRKMGIPTTWSDQICFGVDCFNVLSTETYCTPSNKPLIIADGGSNTFLLHITPDQTMDGTGVYRYYLTNDCTTFEDSVDVQVNFSVVGLKTNAPLTQFSVSPNPANDMVTISTKGIDNSSIKIIDVLGNVVFIDQMNASKKIDVSEFKNGIYFVSVESNGNKLSNRKLIIRH